MSKPKNAPPTYRFARQLLLLTLCLCPALAGRSTAAQGQNDDEARLVARLSDADEEQRLTALINLAALFKTARRAAQPTTTAALAQVLQRDPIPVVRTQAARGLEFAGDAGAVPALLAALTQERELPTRKAIIYALARYPSAQVVAALLPLLKVKDKEIDLRTAAAYALAEIADPTAAVALLEILQKRRSDKDAFTRGQAARGLGRIGYRAAADELLKLLIKDPFPDVRREAAEALGALATSRDGAVIAALRTASFATDPHLSQIAAAALQRIAVRANLP